MSGYLHNAHRQIIICHEQLCKWSIYHIIRLAKSLAFITELLNFQHFVSLMLILYTYLCAS